MAVTLALVATVVTVLCACFWFWRFQTSRVRQLVNQIPGPPALPLLGNVHQMASGPEWFRRILEWGSTYQSHGLYRMWLFNYSYVNLCSAETTEVLLKSSKHTDKSAEYNFLHDWLGTGLLTSGGQKWHWRRKTLTPAFHYRILEEFVQVFHQQSQVLVHKLQNHVGQGSFDVFQDIALCTLDIICETAMGVQMNAQSKPSSEYVQAVYTISRQVDERMRTPWHWNKFLYDILGEGKDHDRCLKILKDFTRKVINDRRNSFDAKQAEAMLSDASTDGSKEEEEDIGGSCKVRLAFLDLLLHMSDNGQVLSIDDIQEEVDTFMFEGHDTTAAAISWCTHLVASDPEVQDKVHEELDRVFGDSDRMPTMNDLKELKYLECCIKEALRLYPSVPYFGRTTTEDATFGGYEVPKGVTVSVLPVALHRDPRWFPDPERFNPDRFLPENSRGRHPYAYIPFSAGPRNCIGQKFALLEEKSVLSAIFRHFRVKVRQTREELLPVIELILRPHNGIFIELCAR